MKLDDILSRLKDPKPDGRGGWWAFCPCHNDGAKRGRRSLHVTEKGGKVLLHCFAGCRYEGIVAALGLARERKQEREEPEAVYRYVDSSGELLFEVCRFPGKRFRQRRPDGAGGWIWSLKDTRRVLYRLPDVLAAVEENRTVFIVEGEKDADNLAALGLVATTAPGGAGKWQAEYSEALRGADVVILPDNDEPGRKHAAQVAKALHGVAARVRVVELPDLPEKGDVSDWLAAGGTKERLLELVEAAQEWQSENQGESTQNPLAGTPYTVEGGRLCWRKPTRDGEVTLPLCDFTARIVRDVARDDGAEEIHVFEIEGWLATGKPLPRITVPAEKFFAMNWVAQWGVDAVISAGMGARDRLREAIQLASKGTVQERVFAHIGWRKIGNRWCYLHAGGAVGAEGVLVDPESESLRRYALPLDGSPEEGLKASLRLLHIGPPEVVLPLWCAVWRAPTASLLYPTVVLWLHGETGSFKSTLAALFLSHFGGPFMKDSLPGSWLATDNALERLCFLARDAVLVIDDYAPEQHPREAAALDKRVARVVRQAGNRAARARLQGDLKTRPETPPNALVISTGEQLPLGVRSVAARILPVLCERDRIDLQKLSQAQAEVRLLAQAMRGYLEWLAPQMDELARTLPRRFEELRARATIAGHARLPEAVAHLYLGAELGLRYGVETGVLDETYAEWLAQQAWNILLALAREFAKVLEEEKPALKFLQTLDAIFAQGKGHLVDRQTGGQPPMAHRFGWTYLETEDGQGDYRRSGELLGWADADGLYLIPEAAWRAVTEYLRAAGGFPVRERTLRDMLAREGILQRDNAGKTARAEWCEGIKRRVLVLDLRKYLSLCEKGVPSVPEPANPDAARVPSEHPRCSKSEKSVPEGVPGDPNGTPLQPDGTPVEHLRCSAESLENEGLEGHGTPGTPCAGEGTYKDCAGIDLNELTDMFGDSPFGGGNR